MKVALHYYGENERSESSLYMYGEYSLGRYGETLVNYHLLHMVKARFTIVKVHRIQSEHLPRTTFTHTSSSLRRKLPKVLSKLPIYADTKLWQFSSYP